MSEKPIDTAEQIEDLNEEAEALEERARREGLLPPREDDDGVGPQTGAVP